MTRLVLNQEAFLPREEKRRDFEAKNFRGVTLRTFGDQRMALAWVAEHAPEHTDLHVEEVTVTVTRKRVGRAALRVAS